MNWLRNRAGHLALLVSASLLGVANVQIVFKTSSAVAGAEEAYFVFDAQPRKDLFVIKLTDPGKIQKARDILSGKETNARHVSGVIVKQPACYNTPWSFHLDPQSIEFFQSAIEVCD